ncbi:MAG: pyridoxal-phosphate dependent enzyme [Chitinophagaceae bacterium]|nr:pyridoxal-phosphate dependent enzyme [Chitinophagaceae bacterium]
MIQQEPLSQGKNATIFNSILDTIGNTPLVRLNKVTQKVRGNILAKVEYFNPGNSVKDRMAIRMIEEAERSGVLKPGGTIIESTSGNTGMGIAIASAVKGYKCIFTMADKQSQEKINILRSVGAEVVVCPTNVSPEDPRSYYSMARKFNAEIPNSFYTNQYDNMANSLAHYETTGPEIWEQTGGSVTHYVACVGTGGTLCGAAQFLREKNKNISVIGIDTYGSVFKKYKETGIFDENEIYPYLTEGFGEDILPKNVNFNIIDSFIKVTDKDAALMARRLSKEEGLFVGWSSGSVVHGALEYAETHMKDTDTMVVLLPDHGTRYIHKIYSDNWMKDHGFLDARMKITAQDIILNRKTDKHITTIQKSNTVAFAISLFNKEGFSQIPVMDNGQIVGSITETKLLNKFINNPEIKKLTVGEIMDPPFQFVGLNTTVDVLASLINKDTKALLVRDIKEDIYIITEHDILLALM